MLIKTGDLRPDSLRDDGGKVKEAKELAQDSYFVTEADALKNLEKNVRKPIRSDRR